jgi:molybdopterin-binding protein
MSSGQRAAAISYSAVFPVIVLLNLTLDAMLCRQYNPPMKISARNQLRGKVEAVVLGVVTAKVAVRVGENIIESVITRQSVDDLGLKVGDEVTAVIKSTEIMLMVD